MMAPVVGFFISGILRISDKRNLSVFYATARKALESLGRHLPATCGFVLYTFFGLFLNSTLKPSFTVELSVRGCLPP